MYKCLRIPKVPHDSVIVTQPYVREIKGILQKHFNRCYFYTVKRKKNEAIRL